MYTYTECIILESIILVILVVVMEDSPQVNGFDNCNKEESDVSRLINSEEQRPKKKLLVPPKLRGLFPFSFKTEQPRRYVNGIVAISSLGSFLWGYNFAIIGGAMLFIDDHFHLSVLWHEAIVSVLVGGATVGAAIAGTLNDKFGRWKVMMLSTILNIVAAVVMAFAFSEVFLVIGRTIAGLALGMVILIHVYYAIL